MRYMLLIYDDERNPGPVTPADREASMKEWFAYTIDMKKAGAYLLGDPLQPTRTATTVRSKGGKVLTTDGPFAETKEQLGGYYLIDVPNLDEALRWAGRCPGARTGSIEVRPIMEIPGRPA
ncbi:MAG TPA: YciI family protein [Anaeromyxobacteraceae bacterium]|nr:YciI family protein [Anaeromyxobacteraceae bacterium]